MERQKVSFPNMWAELVFQKDEEKGLMHVQYYQEEQFLMGFLLKDARSWAEILKSMTDNIGVFRQMIEKAVDILESPEKSPKE